MVRLLLVSQDVLPAGTPSWWEMFSNLFNRVFDRSFLQIDLLDLLPVDHPFYEGRVAFNGLDEFRPGVKPQRPVELPQASLGPDACGTYFPASNIDEAKGVISGRKGPMYDWLVFPGSRFSLHSDEGRLMSVLLEWTLVEVLPCSQGAKLLGICYGFELLAELLIGQGTLQPNPQGHNIQYCLRSGLAMPPCSNHEQLPQLPPMPETFYTHWDFLPCIPGQTMFDVCAHLHGAAGAQLVVTHANPQVRCTVPNAGAFEAATRAWLRCEQLSLPQHPMISVEQYLEEEHEGNETADVTNRWISVAFRTEQQRVFGLQGHPEFTANGYQALLQRCSGKDALGINGVSNMPMPMPPVPVAQRATAAAEASRDNTDTHHEDAHLLYNFPVMPNPLAVASFFPHSPTQERARLQHDTKDFAFGKQHLVTTIEGANSLAPGMVEWLRAFLGVTVGGSKD